MSATTAPEAKTISLISFIVPAWNEEALLGATLTALKQAARTLPVAFELIVADDDSTDRTAAIAREQGAQVVSVRNRQIAATRNAGARLAKGDLLIFVDADTRVTPEVLQAALKAVQEGAVGGGCSIRMDGRMRWHVRALVSGFTWLYRLAKLAGGCFLFCRREAFDAAGGFDERLYASEECSLSLALRRQGRFVVLREHVITSGRKLRTYSWGEFFRYAVRILCKGRGALRDRRGLDLWYGPRRVERESGSEV